MAHDMSGTAKCLDCGQKAEYDSLRTLVIRHKADCPQLAEPPYDDGGSTFEADDFDGAESLLASMPGTGPCLVGGCNGQYNPFGRCVVCGDVD
jgi:hypothetical protein